MLLNQQGFQALSLDSNANIYNNIPRPEPTTNIISPQLCMDLGIDPLTTFSQSNQACNNFLNQLILTKTELPQRQEELLSINKRFEVGVSQNPIQAVDLRQLQESSVNLHNYVLELDSKIGRTKTTLINQLETSYQLMNQAMHSLVADKLVGWLVKQKVISCGARATIKFHYDELDVIDAQFEECGRQIVALVNLLANVEQTIGHVTTDDLSICSKIHKIRSDLVQNSRQFIWQSIIVSVQPPAVLVKCRVSDSHRSTRFPCKTELRILGGQALGVRESNKTGVQVELISEEMARQIQHDPCKAAEKDQSFNLIYNESHFQLDSTTTAYNLPIYRAVFDRIRLVENVIAQKRTAVDAGFDEKRGTRRSKVSSLRYYLAFRIQTGPFLQNCRGSFGPTENNYIDVSGYKLSLPVAALVHSSLEADASLFWNRAFSEGTGILSFVPDTVDFEKAKMALNLKWGGIIQEPQDIKDLLIDPPEPRSLTSENFAHLAMRLEVSNGILHRKNFFNKAIAHKENKEGHPIPSVFYEWFYKCGSIVNKYMIEQWNDGCIMGFCSKECSEKILCATIQPTMLIRFSDLVLGYLKISCKLTDNRVVHYETEAEKMPLGTSISDAIRSNPTFAFIQNIYPNRRVSSLWQDREKVEESRAANWTGIPNGYFDKVYSLESKPVASH